MALKKLRKLKGFGHKVVTFPPPKRSDAIGCVIVMLRRQYEGVDSLARHLLFAANILDWNNKIRIHLEEGSAVLLDRYVYSGIAYMMALKKRRRRSHRFNGTSPTNADCSLRQI